MPKLELVQGPSWYAHRYNAVPFGNADTIAARFVDTLEDAATAKTQMLQDGAIAVDIFDTITGEFIQ